jgi:hypothetical protein
LPASRSAASILPYAASVDASGALTGIAFNEKRALLLLQLTAAEYDKVRQFKSIDMVEKCTIEQLKEILDDSRLFGIAKSIDAIQIAQGCLFEQQIITILKNEWGTFSKIGINNCSNAFKNLLTKLKNQWGTSFEELQKYKLNTQISLKVTGGNWVTDILLTNKIPGTNNINAYVAECKLNATTLNSQRQNEGILQHQTNPNQPFENRSDAANRKTKINVMSDDLEVGSLLTIKSRAKVNLVGQNHEVTFLNPNN